jgi:hypothetical protein
MPCTSRSRGALRSMMLAGSQRLPVRREPSLRSMQLDVSVGLHAT